MRGDNGYLHGGNAGGGKTISQQNDEASEQYPSVLIERHLLHVYEQGGEWHVWLNCEDMDFTGLCLGLGATRDEAVEQAVQALEAITEKLQGPPW